MPRKIVCIPILILCLMFGACGKKDSDKPAATAKDTSAVVAKIGDETITLNQLNRAISHLPLPYQEKFQTEMGRKYVLDDLITVSLFSREAERLKLDQKPEVSEALESVRKRILSSELLRGESAKLPDPGDKEAEAYYKANQDQFTTSQDFKLRQVVLPTQQEAEKVAKELASGADFKKLAKEKSVDPSKNNGGYLGWVSRRAMSPEIAQALCRLSKGQMSAPFRLGDRYHIFLVEDKKTGKPVEYIQVRTAILQELHAEKEKKTIDQLRTRLYKEMNVAIMEDQLKAGLPPK